MFKTRLISGIILVLLLILIMVPGGWILFSATLALSLLGAFELYRAAGIHREKGKFNLLEISGYAGIVLYYFSMVFRWGNYRLIALMVSLMLIMAVYVFTYPTYASDQVMTTYFGILYVGVMLSYIYLCRMLDQRSWIAGLIFICSWGCDTSAYCVGRLIGQHPMAHLLSPKKTMEGALGGVLGAMLLGGLYAFFTRGPVLEYVLICMVGAFISMIGDLAASAIKRNKGIKDYGHLIPGHGGILDRFDSVIFTAPMIYFLAIVLL